MVIHVIVGMLCQNFSPLGPAVWSVSCLSRNCFIYIEEHFRALSPLLGLNFKKSIWIFNKRFKIVFYKKEYSFNINCTLAEKFSNSKGTLTENCKLRKASWKSFHFYIILHFLWILFNFEEVYRFSSKVMRTWTMY